MAKNPYEILGVSKTASDGAIKAAYRKLAKKFHPDLNPGKKDVEEKFKEISAAHGLLSDKDKRAAFDRGEIDMEGQPQYKQQQQYYRDFAQSPDAGAYHQGGFNASDIEDLFGSFFTGGIGGREAGFKKQAADAHYRMEIEFLEAALGASKRLTLPDGKVLDVTIPAGVEDGKQLRLKGRGAPGIAGSPAGDAYIEVHIRPHPQFTRKGNDIYTEIPVGFQESILAAKIPVPTIHGTVEMAIPKGAGSGVSLRLKGKGIKGGDQYVKLRIMLPPVDADLERLVEDWAKTHDFNPRAAKEAA